MRRYSFGTAITVAAFILQIELAKFVERSTASLIFIPVIVATGFWAWASKEWRATAITAAVGCGIVLAAELAIFTGLAS